MTHILRDYKCDNCGVEFEEWSNNNTDSIICPSCKGTKVSAVISAPALIKLFGQGAYNRSHKDTGDWA